MSHILDRLSFFKDRKQGFAGGHGVTTEEDRKWEEAYRKRWQHDKVVRSTHGANSVSYTHLTLPTMDSV